MTEATEIRKPVQDGADGVSSGAVGVQTARRRLMLGAAAALPSVYTLTSGAQTAVASNARCIDRERGNQYDFRSRRVPGDIPLLTMQPDGWLRKEVYYGLCEGTPAYCAFTDQAACVDPVNPGKAALGSTWIVTDGYRVVVGPSVTIAQVSSAAQGYGLVFVDEDGTIATLDPSGSEQLYPVKEQCWTSILGTRKSMLG